MDLVHQDMEVREKLKESYLQNKYSVNEKNSHYRSNESRQYLLDEPSGNEKDLPAGNKIITVGDGEKHKWPIGFFAQTCILFQRNWILTSKIQLSKLNCIQALFMSILFGLFWLRMPYTEKTLTDRSSLIYFLLMFWPFEICFGAILSFPGERSIIEKERASGSYRLSAYYFAKCLSETPLKLVLPTFSTTIVYWMGNMNPNFGIFLAVVVFILMIVLVAESFALLFGAALQDVGKAWISANIILLGLLLAGGYFIENIPHWLHVWVKWLSFYKYGYDGALRLQFMGGHLYQCVNGARIDICKNNINGTFTGDDALKYFRPDLSVGLNFLVLFGMFIALRIAIYLALRFIKKSDSRT